MSFDLVQLPPASCCVLLRLAAPTNPYTYSTTVLDPSCKRHASFLTRFVSNPYVSCCFVLLSGCAGTNNGSSDRDDCFLSLSRPQSYGSRQRGAGPSLPGATAAPTGGMAAVVRPEKLWKTNRRHQRPCACLSSWPCFSSFRPHRMLHCHLMKVSRQSQLTPRGRVIRVC